MVDFSFLSHIEILFRTSFMSVAYIITHETDNFVNSINLFCVKKKKSSVNLLLWKIEMTSSA